MKKKRKGYILSDTYLYVLHITAYDENYRIKTMSKSGQISSFFLSLIVWTDNNFNINQRIYEQESKIRDGVRKILLRHLQKQSKTNVPLAFFQCVFVIVTYSLEKYLRPYVIFHNYFSAFDKSQLNVKIYMTSTSIC